jgi:hypothetical protein
MFSSTSQSQYRATLQHLELGVRDRFLRPTVRQRLGHVLPPVAVRATRDHYDRSGGRFCFSSRSRLRAEVPGKGRLGGKQVRLPGAGCTCSPLKKRRGGIPQPVFQIGPSVRLYLRPKQRKDLTPAESALMLMQNLTPLESALTKSVSKPPGISTYKNKGSGGGGLCYPNLAFGARAESPRDAAAILDRY